MNRHAVNPRDRPRLLVLNPTCLEVVEQHREWIERRGVELWADPSNRELDEAAALALAEQVDGLILPAAARNFPRPEQMAGCPGLLVEDPIRSEHAAGYRHVRAHTSVPLAAGEQWANKWEFRQAIEEELIDYARIDICIAGGLTEARKIAAMAETHLIKILPHNPLGPVCTAASLHLDLACDNASIQEVVFPPATMLPDVFECAFELQGTQLTIPTASGIGVKFNRDAAKHHPPEVTEPPHFHRNDGSYTNY